MELFENCDCMAWNPVVSTGAVEIRIGTVATLVDTTGVIEKRKRVCGLDFRRNEDCLQVLNAEVPLFRSG